MNMEETLTLVAWMLAPAFFGLLGLAAFGSPAVAALGQVVAKAKKRVFYDKYGQQTAAMGLRLLLIAIAVYAVGLGVAAQRYPQHMQSFHPTTAVALAAIGALAAFILFGTLHALTWKKLRNQKAVHISLGVGAAVASIVCVGLTVPTKLQFSLTSPENAAAVGGQVMAFPLAVMHLFFIVAAAAGLSCVYLVLRRNKDDFGRDYYVFALKLAARWAALAMVAAVACQGWLFAVLPQSLKTMTLETPLAYVWAGAVILALVCLAGWTALARSAAPLRFKGLTFAAAFALWFMHTLNVTLFFNFMTMAH